MNPDDEAFNEWLNKVCSKIRQKLLNESVTLEGFQNGFSHEKFAEQIINPEFIQEPEIPFEQWMEEVDEWCKLLTGKEADDLKEPDYRFLWEDNEHPADAALHAKGITENIPLHFPEVEPDE